MIQTDRAAMLKLIEDFLSEYPIAARTIATYRVYLGYFSDFLESKQIDPATVNGALIKRWYEDNEWSENTRRIAHCAIRAFVRHTYGDDHPALRMRVRSVKAGPQRTLTAAQVLQLVNSLDPVTDIGMRNLALILLMLDTGLRAAEVCRLKLKNLDLENRSLRVRIKGGDWGHGAYTDITAGWLRAWLRLRSKLAAADVDSVFVAVGGGQPGQPLTRDGLRGVFRRMGQAAGLGLISPHDMRRTFATLAIRNGAPTRLVQVAGRWKNIREVETYTQPIEATDLAPYSPVARMALPQPPGDVP